LPIFKASESRLDTTLVFSIRQNSVDVPASAILYIHTGCAEWGFSTNKIPTAIASGCEHFAEWRAGGAVILCMHEGRPYVQAMPDRGCVHWVRAIGSDDEKKKAKRRA
jgi:hypothetical protein